jgi:hypothetical protein
MNSKGGRKRQTDTKTRAEQSSCSLLQRQLASPDLTRRPGPLQLLYGDILANTAKELYQRLTVSKMMDVTVR